MRSRRHGFTLIEVLIVTVIIATLASIITPNLRHSVESTRGTACSTNLSNLAKAVELYHNDNLKYPAALGDVFPGYLPSMPICPSAQRDSYTAGYQVTPELDNFTVTCSGRNHAGLGLNANEPFFNPTSGLGPR